MYTCLFISLLTVKPPLDTKIRFFHKQSVTFRSGKCKQIDGKKEASCLDGGGSDLYCSALRPLLVTTIDHYWSTSEAVLLHSSTSSDRGTVSARRKRGKKRVFTRNSHVTSTFATELTATPQRRKLFLEGYGKSPAVRPAAMVSRRPASRLVLGVKPKVKRGEGSQRQLR